MIRVALLAFSVLAAESLAAPSAAADDRAVCADRKAPGAIAACTRLIEALPPAAEPLGAAALYVDRALAFYTRDDKRRALQDFVEASRRDPRDSDALIWSASIHHDYRNWTAAIADATEALRRNPERAEAYNTRGDALTQIGEYQRAIADLTETLRRDPKFRVAYINRAGAYRKIGRDDLALADYEAVTGLHPEWEVGHRRRAELLMKLGRYAEAVPTVTRRIELRRDYDRFADRAAAYAAMGEYKLALADYDAAIERRHLSRLYGKRAAVHLMRGDIAAAAADARKALGARSDDDISLLFMAGIVFLGAFMSWIKALLAIAAAIAIRRPLPGVGVAAVVGAAEFLLTTGDALLSRGFILPEIDASVAAAAVLSALAGVAWWGIGRALCAISKRVQAPASSIFRKS